MPTTSQKSSTAVKARRPLQSLGQKTPDVVYKTAMGGGAMIWDKYPRVVEEYTVPLRATACSSTAKKV